MEVPSKAKTRATYEPTISLLGIQPEKNMIWKETCTLMFIAALFTIVKTWKQPKCPSAEEWIKKVSYIYTMEYYSTIKKNVAAAAAASLQSCPTLCDPRDGSPPGSAIPGILQARILEWVAISFSNAWKWNVKVKSLSRVRLLATPSPAGYQTPPSMGFSRWEYWSGLPLPSP